MEDCHECYFPGVTAWMAKHGCKPLFAWRSLLARCTHDDLRYASRQMAIEGETLPFSAHPGRLVAMVADNPGWKRRNKRLALEQCKRLAEQEQKELKIPDRILQSVHSEGYRPALWGRIIAARCLDRGCKPLPQPEVSGWGMASETLLTAPNRSTNGIAHGMFMRRQNDSNPPLDHEADYPDLWKPEQSAERNPAEHVEEGVSNMEIVDAIKKVIQDLIAPELNSIKAENREIKVIQELTNKRLDDITAQPD